MYLLYLSKKRGKKAVDIVNNSLTSWELWSSTLPLPLPLPLLLLLPAQHAPIFSWTYILIHGMVQHLQKLTFLFLLVSFLDIKTFYSMTSSLMDQSSKLPSGKNRRTMIGIFLSRSSFCAIIKGSVSFAISTMTGALREIWSARVPRTRARSYLVMYLDVIRSFIGTARPAWFKLLSSLERNCEVSSLIVVLMFGVGSSRITRK